MRITPTRRTGRRTTARAAAVLLATAGCVASVAGLAAPAQATTTPADVPVVAPAVPVAPAAPAAPSNGCVGKTAWPELVGTHAKRAEKVIERENPTVDATAVPEGSAMTMDLRCDRVRILVKDFQHVTKTPTVG